MELTKTYDVFGRLATETNARGMVKTQAYDAPTGQLIGIGFSNVDTPGQDFEYNVQGPSWSAKKRFSSLDNELVMKDNRFVLNFMVL